MHVMGKEIASIDWIDISDQMMNEMKYPPPTKMKLKELDIICNKENVLMKEYKKAYFIRNVTAIRPKFALCKERGPLLLWNRDYLYHQLDLDEVECSKGNEENEKNMHRIYSNVDISIYHIPLVSTNLL